MMQSTRNPATNTQLAPAHTRRSRERRGVGVVLLVVMVIVMAACVITAARQVQASRVTGSAQTVEAGAMALQAANAALEEVLVTLGRQANDPDHALFKHLRQGQVPRGMEMTVPAPLTLAQLRADPMNATLTLTGGGVRVSLLERKRMGLTQTEHEGRVRLVCEAVHVPTGTLRRVTREHSLRVSHLSTPRPFDQFTWCVVNGERQLDPAANTRMAEAVEALTDLRTRRAPKLVDEVKDAVKKFNRMVDALAGGKSDKHIDEAELASLFDPAKFAEPPVIGDSVTAGFHWFPSAVVMFSKTNSPVQLADLYLKPRADRAASDSEAAWTAATKTISAYEQATTKLHDAVRKSSARNVDISVMMRAFAEWLGTLRPLSDALERSSEARAAQLDLYKSYQESATELTDSARSALLQQATQLDTDAMSRRAVHRFEGAGSEQRALEFLGRYCGPTSERSLHATVFVDNRGGRPFNLDSLRGSDGKVRIRGKVTLAVSGAVDLANIVLGDRTTDLFVVYAGGVLAARERVEASLIAADEFRPTDLVLSGNLVLAGAFDPARLAGVLDRDGGRYASGAGRSLVGVYTQAALSPWALKSFVERTN